MIPFYKATFIKSAAHLDQCPPDHGIEIAFVGRSNAGKSSAINTLFNEKIARTSKTPGQTQLMNFFHVDDTCRIVDLPGYGFAKVPDKIKKQIESILQNYLSERACLFGIFLMMDIRRPLTEVDQQLIELAAQYNLYVHILLTKSDKLNRGQAQNTLLSTRKALATYPNITVQSFSALKNTGLDEAQRKIAEWFSGDVQVTI